MLVLGDGDDRVLMVPPHCEEGQAVTLWRARTGVNTGHPVAGGGRIWVQAAQAGSANHGVGAPGVGLLIEAGPDSGLFRFLPRGESIVGRIQPGSSARTRVSLSDLSLPREAARLNVSTLGVHFTACTRNVRVNARRPAPRTEVSSTDSITLGRNTARLLPTPPRMPASVLHGSDPLSLSRRGAPPPRLPWLTLAACIAPLAIGGLLWWSTGAWYLALIGMLGLVTAGPSAVADLVARRADRKDLTRQARQAALSAHSQYPPPGFLAAAWGRDSTEGARARDSATSGRTTTAGAGRGRDRHASAPESPSPRTQESVVTARVGLVLKPRARLGVQDSPRAKGYPLPSCPALVHTPEGGTLLLEGRQEIDDAVIRAVVLAWAVRAGESGGVLHVDDDAALPASLLALPQVRRSSLPPGTVARLVTAGIPTSIGARREPAEATLLRGDAHEKVHGTEVCRIRASRGELTTARRTHRFLPEGLSMPGLDEAVRRVARKAPASNAEHLYPQARDPWAVPLGANGEPEGILNLRGDGPHALVAGTTGSGKSALLTAWLLGLAAALPPTQLRLVLFDFKGGSTFAPFAALPHTEALVTDLEPEAAAHVLDAVRAELERRETWLAAEGFGDLAAAHAHPRCPPRMVLAMDEYRVLSEELPEHLTTLVRLATVGRSLGLHLILATQRPQGVISSDIRANVSLLVCLRVASEADSTEVLGHPGAARLPAAEPGSALVSTGGAPPAAVRFAPPPLNEQFKAHHALPSDSAAQRSTDEATAPHRAEPAALLLGPTLADAVGLPLARSSPSLAERVRALSARDQPPQERLIPLPLAPTLERVAVSRSDRGLLLGLQQPAQGLPVPLTWDAERDGGAAGLTGSAAEAAAVSTAWLAQAARRPELLRRSVIFDGVACSYALSSQADAPGAAPLAIVTPSDEQWCDEVLEALKASPAQSRTVVWVLGLASWLGEAGTAAGAQRAAALFELLGRPGIIAVVVGGRELAGSRWLAHCPWRVYFPFEAGPETTALWPRLRSCTQAPGRGVFLGAGDNGTGRLVQWIRPAITAPPVTAPASLRPHPTQWNPVPDAIPSDALPPPYVGVSGVGAQPLVWRPRGSTAMIVGAPGSGRTHAMGLLLRSWGEEHSVWEASGTPPDPATWAVIDNADRWPRDALYAVHDRIRAGGRVLATASASGALGLPWWGLLDHVADVVLLGPRSPAELQGLGWAIPLDPSAPPGRAWLSDAGSGRLVRAQLAAPPTRAAQERPDTVGEDHPGSSMKSRDTV